MRLTVAQPQIDSSQSIFDCTKALYMLRSKADGRIFSKDETYENNDIFFYIILEYDRPNLDRFLPRGPNIWLVWQYIVYWNL